MSASLPKLVPGHSIEPLFEGAETFAALERAVAGATRSVHMAYWRVDPGAKLRTKEGREAGTRWPDLVAAAVRRGVAVRMIINDFDAVYGGSLHEDAWRAYGVFARLGAELEKEGAPGSLAVICSRHPARLGWVPRVLIWPLSRHMLDQAANRLTADLRTHGRKEMLARLSYLPGLWSHLRVDDDAVRSAPMRVPKVHPAVHHEKTCVVDGSEAFLGGLDIDAKRYDTRDHDHETAWHDIACRLRGPCVADLERHFRRRWNAEIEAFDHRLRALAIPEGCDKLPAAPRLEPLAEPNGTAGAQAAGPARATLVRTLTQSDGTVFALTPRTTERSFANAVEWIIRSARRLLYIETQYLRWRPVGDWILDHAARHPELEVIVLLPLVPERISENGYPDAATRHGQHLEGEILRRLGRGLRQRFGVFTLVRNAPAPPDTLPEAERHGSDLVYVHAKTIISDDRVAMIGSGNLNGRSMCTDTETSLVWEDGEGVAAYRRELWQRLLRAEVAHWEAPFVPKWDAAAREAAATPPGQRTGFVVPLGLRTAATYGERALSIGDTLV